MTGTPTQSSTTPLLAHLSNLQNALETVTLDHKNLLFQLSLNEAILQQNIPWTPETAEVLFTNVNAQMIAWGWGMEDRARYESCQEQERELKKRIIDCAIEIGGILEEEEEREEREKEERGVGRG